MPGSGPSDPSPSLYESLLAATGGGRPPRPSASVVPWRAASGGLASGGIEVYWVRRSPELRFMGGWHAFPGGGLSRSDAAIPVGGEVAGLAEGAITDALPDLDEATRQRLGPDLCPGLLAGALRELWEEIGVLLAPPVLGGALGITERAALADGQRRLLAKEASFAEILSELPGKLGELDASPLVFAGRWLTPPLAPVRFDNRFFLLEWPAEHDLQPEVIPGELAEGEWIAPHRALESWESGEVITAPPILHLLRVLAEDGPAAGLGRLRDPAEANLGPFRRVEFHPGVVLLPLETPTLPPATHTNAYILGREEVVLVDPATPHAAETERLLAALDAVRARGQRIREIWLTHHHPDHVGAVEAVRRHLGVEVAAHRATAERLAEWVEVDRHLEDGELVILDGAPPFPVRVIHTPGHAQGHLCFLDQDGGSLIAGDLVSGVSTIVIDPPEGDMEAYLSSLEGVAALEPSTLFPGHGPPIVGGAVKLRELRQHRLWREDKIRAAWAAGKRQPEAMVAEVYEDVPAALHPVACRQILAHLERLKALGEL